MTSVLKVRRSVLMAAGVLVALLGGVLAIRYSRSSRSLSEDSSRVPLGASQTAVESQDAAPGHRHREPVSPSVPAGYATVTIDPARTAALRLSTAPVEEREFTKTLRTVGVVTLDETRTAHVHAKVRGWIDSIDVDFVGRSVRAGEPLCFIYSQDVYSAEVEFLSILERAPRRPEPDPLLDAARQRLALWDVPKGEVARLEQTREARRTFPLLAPRTGVVVSKEAIQGMYVDPSLELYTLSDLSRVWVLVDVYEAEVPYVHVGDRARLTIEGQSVPVDARVVFLAPTIDEATRTRKVRLELNNLDGRLLPGAFTSAELELPMGKGLAIPESAVIRTGARSIVFVALGEHGEQFEPRAVKLGPLVGDRYRVEAGLSAGERVATGAQFLLDSESRLRATSASGSGHVH